MRDLTNPRWIKFKGILFLFGGIISSAILLFDRHDIKTVFLLGVSIWCFCRFYYSAFYVIEHYVDSSYRFSGIISFVRYVIGCRKDK
jgi:hypothetical protein